MYLYFKEGHMITLRVNTFENIYCLKNRAGRLGSDTLKIKSVTEYKLQRHFVS